MLGFGLSNRKLSLHVEIVVAHCCAWNALSCRMGNFLKVWAPESQLCVFCLTLAGSQRPQTKKSCLSLQELHYPFVGYVAQYLFWPSLGSWVALIALCSVWTVPYIWCRSLFFPICLCRVLLWDSPFTTASQSGKGNQSRATFNIDNHCHIKTAVCNWSRARLVRADQNCRAFWQCVLFVFF